METAMCVCWCKMAMKNGTTTLLHQEFLILHYVSQLYSARLPMEMFPDDCIGVNWVLQMAMFPHLLTVRL